MNWSGFLGTPVVPQESGTPKVMDLPAFDGYADPKKLDVISRIAERAGRDPQLATVAVGIFRKYRVQPRDYKAQAAALLDWVQKNIYYVNEPDERLQDPFYTLKVKYGDCDDLGILVYALARSVRLPARFVISGLTRSGKKVRYHQGDRKFDRSVDWNHIYLQIGDRPYGEPQWLYAEPTLRVPLGWDVVAHNGDILPEMAPSTSYGYTMSYSGPSAAAVSGTVAYSPTTTTTSKRYAPSASSFNLANYVPPASYPSASAYAPSVTTTYPSVAAAAAAAAPGTTYAPSVTTTYPSVAAAAPGTTYPSTSGTTSTTGTTGTTSTELVTPPGQAVEAPSAQAGGDADGSANAVAILLVDRGGQILLLHRAPGSSFMGGAWDLPGAKIDPRFSARAQAVKVLAAETGIQLPQQALRVLLTAYHPTAGTSLFFVAEVADDVARQAKLHAPEHVAFRWVSPKTGSADMQLVPYMPLVLETLRKSRGGTQYGAPLFEERSVYGVGALLAAAAVGLLLGKMWK